MDPQGSAPSKRSLSQQILRTFRPRATTTAAPLSASAAALPLPTAVDYSLGIGTSSHGPRPHVDGPNFAQLGSLPRPSSPAEFNAHFEELRKPLPLSQPKRDDAIRDRSKRLCALTSAVTAAIDATNEPSSASSSRGTVGRGKATDTKPIEPPLGEIFRVCILLLGEAREMPIPLRVAVCDLATESVRLSDLRAAAGPKAVRETRSGAPGSQSSKSSQDVQALANIDRALIYRLVSDLSFGCEGQGPTREDPGSTALPAIHSQLKAFGILSNRGRDVVAFRGIVELLASWLSVEWAEVQALRTMARMERGAKPSGLAPPSGSSDAGDELQSAQASSQGGRSREARIEEETSIREWNISAIYHLLTSIFKFSFARVELRSIQKVLHQVADLFTAENVPVPAAKAIPTPTAAKVQTATLSEQAARRRAKSRDARKAYEGYDYYGLSVLSGPDSGSDTPSPAITPKVATPKVIPRSAPLEAAASGAVAAAASLGAPIGLATIPAGHDDLEVRAKGKARLQGQLAEIQDSDVKAALLLFDATLRYGYMPPACVEHVVEAICTILGYPAAVATTAAASAAAGIDWQALAAPVLANVLRSHCANAAIRSVRMRLVSAKRSKTESTAELAVDIGAVVFLRFALTAVAEHASQSSARDPAAQQAAHDEAPSRQDALTPRLTLPLLMPALRGALRRQSDRLDLEVLRLVADIILEQPRATGAAAGAPGDGDTRSLLSEQLTVSDWDELLDLTVAARRHVEGWKLKGSAPSPFDLREPGSGTGSSFSSDTPPVVHAMLQVLSAVNLASPTAMAPTEPEEARSVPGVGGPGGLPWTDKLAALLLSLAPMLPDPMVVDLVHYFQAQHLCLPSTPEWIANIRSLLHAFFHRHENAAADFGALPAPKARQALVHLLFEHVFEAVKDIPAQRTDLLLEVIIPLAQVSLATETDPRVEEVMHRVLVEAASTAGSQSAIAAMRSEVASADAAAEADAAATDSARLKAIPENGLPGEQVLNDIRELLVKLARSKPETAAPTTTSGWGESQGASSSWQPGHSRQSSATGSAPPNVGGGLSAMPAPGAARALSKPQRAVLDLIAIFNRMGFSSLQEASSQEERAACEVQCRNGCLAIFRDLLGLLQPAGAAAADKLLRKPAPASAPSSSSTGTQSTYTTPPPATASTGVRLCILQWMLRIRTDRQHRVYLVPDLDELVMSAATTLLRCSPVFAAAEAAVADEAAYASRGPSAAFAREGREGFRGSTSALDRSKSRQRQASRDRGRVPEKDAAKPSERSVSAARSRRLGSDPTPPMWTIPEKVLFELPPSTLRSDTVFTYIHPEDDPYCSHGHSHVTPNGGPLPLPLPISEWLAMVIRLLACEKDWELLSYVIVFLPHQLANKHLFCGPKARDRIRDLRRMLCAAMLQQNLVPDARLPDEVKKGDVYATTYGTLTMLMSYRTIFDRGEQDEMVEAFMAGLNKSQNTAQPCVRALSVACYELQASFTHWLPSMLIRLSNVMSSVAMSVHILELIASVGHMPACYAHFTEADYRRVFGIALQYIRYHIQYQHHHHHHQQQVSSGGGAPANREDDIHANPTAFALSQYVMMLAHYVISLWFMSLPIPDRAKYVPFIIRGLLVANEGKERVSDQTEVCFDFLSRFAYSNAEPKPRRSFLNAIVAGPNGAPSAKLGGGAAAGGDKDAATRASSKTWIFGKSLVTVTSLKKHGWIEILVRRASGTMSLLCKLENAPVATLPEADEERVELPLVLMMQRDPDRAAKPVQGAPALPPRSFEARRETEAWTVRQRAEHRLRVGDHLRSRRMRGPAHFGLASRPRSASFSGGLSNEAAVIVSTEVSPYAKRTEEEDNLAGQQGHTAERRLAAAPHRESDAMRHVMTEALAVDSRFDSRLTSPAPARQELAPEGGGGRPNAPAAQPRPSGTPTIPKRSPAAPSKRAEETVIDPGFIALQLSAYPDIALDKAPLLLPDEPATDRMIRAVDLTPVVDFHRIGCLYVGPGQRTETEILGNQTGSPAYMKFLAGLGELITLKGQEDVYTGGLDRHNDEHGSHTYVWGDDISQIVFHTAVLMPNREHDPSHAAKKALIGNDWVHIVFNESGDEYRFGTIASQFNFVNVVVSPTTRGGTNLGAVAPQDEIFYRVSLQCRPGLPTFSPLGDGQLISATAMPAFVRLLALNSNLVSQIWLDTGDAMQPYTSSWVSRLHHIQRFKANLEAKRKKEAEAARAADPRPIEVVGPHLGPHLHDFSAHF